MKAIEWVRLFTDQRARHGKGVFTVTELANVASASAAVLNVQFGRLVFVCVGSRVHSRPADRRMAPPEQALCDLVYTSRRRGLDPRSLYTFRKLEQLTIPPDLLARYPNTVQRAVGTLLEQTRN